LHSYVWWTTHSQQRTRPSLFVFGADVRLKFAKFNKIHKKNLRSKHFNPCRWHVHNFRSHNTTAECGVASSSMLDYHVGSFPILDAAELFDRLRFNYRAPSSGRAPVSRWSCRHYSGAWWLAVLQVKRNCTFKNFLKLLGGWLSDRYGAKAMQIYVRLNFSWFFSAKCHLTDFPKLPILTCANRMHNQVNRQRICSRAHFHSHTHSGPIHALLLGGSHTVHHGCSVRKFSCNIFFFF
jgi:hypothetical protein